MSNYSDGPGGITVTGTAAFPATAQVVLSFIPAFTLIENIGSDDISYSFDGTNVHGTVAAGTSFSISTQSHLLPTGHKSIWYRDEGGGGTAIVRTTAYNY